MTPASAIFHAGTPVAALVAPLAMLAAGCVSVPLPTEEELLQAPAPHLADDAPANIEDGRARFREYFCASLAEWHPDEGDACASWLHRLPDEPAPPESSPETQSRALDVLLVGGAFAECFGEHEQPFAAAVDDLRDGVHRIATVPVDGRSGTTHNAAEIAEFLEAWPDDPARPLVLIGYSKGAPDILEFLTGYPQHAARVDAVVSAAGAVGGSRLADEFDGLYDLLFSHLPTDRCERGDGEVVDSLQTDLRRAWLDANPLPAHTRYYSLAAFTTREHVARSLVAAWEHLFDESRRNDGQLVPRDTIIPGSTMLGYLNADHWAVAMEIEKDFEFFAARPDSTPFPRTALLDAVLRQVADDLAADRN